MLLTTFELYDTSLLDEIKERKLDESTEENEERSEKLQDIIDERFKMHRIVQEVVDKKLSEREAIGKIIRERLDSHVQSSMNYKDDYEDDYEDEEEETEEIDNMEKCKKSKLKSFLDSREQRKQDFIEIDKSDISCPDCGTSLYKGESNKVKLCVCYGEHHNKELKFTKNEDGKIKFKFPKNFDLDNAEMILEAMKKDSE